MATEMTRTSGMSKRCSVMLHLWVLTNIVTVVFWKQKHLNYFYIVLNVLAFHFYPLEGFKRNWSVAKFEMFIFYIVILNSCLNSL